MACETDQSISNKEISRQQVSERRRLGLNTSSNDLQQKAGKPARMPRQMRIGWHAISYNLRNTLRVKGLCLQTLLCASTPIILVVARPWYERNLLQGRRHERHFTGRSSPDP